MHRALRAVILLTVLAASMGCGGPRFARCPGEGGRPWQEVESEHFTLRTDLSIEEARTAASYLERTRVALLAAAWPSVVHRRMARVSVYVFGESADFESLFPRRVSGFFSVQDHEPLIVLQGPPRSWEERFSMHSEASSSMLKHELTHHLSTYVLPHQPRWLSEGLAQFLETLRWSGDDGRTAILGTPHLRAAVYMKEVLDLSERGLLRDGAWSMQRVLAWDDRPIDAYEDWELLTLYSGSWLLVHWLYNTRPESFAEYQARLARGMDPALTLAEVLPELSSSEKLETMLLDYLRHGAYQEFTVQVPPMAQGFAERTLEDAEVHSFRAKLALMSADMVQDGAEARRALAQEEMQEALRLEPYNLFALELRMKEAPADEQLSLARAAVEAHPHEGRAWLLLGKALEKRDSPAEAAECEAAYEKAVELAPRDASAASGLAWLYLTRRRFEEAMPLAVRALELAPWNIAVLDTYAMAAAGLGRCAEALVTEQRALGMLREHPNAELEKALRERLAVFTSTPCVPSLTP